MAVSPIRISLRSIKASSKYEDYVAAFWIGLKARQRQWREKVQEKYTAGPFGRKNVVILHGKIPFEPKMIETKTGFPICSMRLGFSNKKDKITGQWISQYVEVKALGDLAHDCLKNLMKGDIIEVKGKLQSYEYEKEGKKQNLISVLAEEIYRPPGTREKDEWRSDPRPKTEPFTPKESFNDIPDTIPF